MTDLQPLDRITFEKPLTLSKDIGQEGELAWIPIAKLFIDTSYQRSVLEAGKKNVRRIAEEFNWAYFAPLVVAPRGTDRYAVIDGQHKSLAVLARGDIKKLPCLIIKADYATQAKAFSVINGQVTRLHTLQTFRARIAAGEKAAVEIDTCCRKAGVLIAPYPKPASTKLKNETLAVGSIETMYARFGAEVLTKALSFLVAADACELLGKVAIRGAAACLHERPLWLTRSADELVRAVATPGIKKMFADAVAGRSGGDGYVTFAGLLAAKFEAAFGDSGRPAPPPKPERPQQVREPKPATVKVERPARTASKAGEAAAKRKTEDLQRQAAVNRAAQARPVRAAEPAKKAVAKSDAAAIAEFIAKKGVRKFEMGATSQSWVLLEYLNAKGYKIEPGQKMMYRYRGRLIPFAKLVELANAERKKEGKQPYTVVKAA